jgi:hypothetical protein
MKRAEATGRGERPPVAVWGTEPRVISPGALFYEGAATKPCVQRLGGVQAQLLPSKLCLGSGPPKVRVHGAFMCGVFRYGYAYCHPAVTL